VPAQDPPYRSRRHPDAELAAFRVNGRLGDQEEDSAFLHGSGERLFDPGKALAGVPRSELSVDGDSIRVMVADELDTTPGSGRLGQLLRSLSAN
jgi:hypothetical protein